MRRCERHTLARRGVGRVAVATFSVLTQPCLTLTATICGNIVVYEEERRVYGLLPDAQLLPLAADQPPPTKDVTCQQLPAVT